MTLSSYWASTLTVLRWRVNARMLVAVGLVLVSSGCSNIFSSSFLALFPSSDAASNETLANAPGHVIVAVNNQTEVDERLLDYLVPRIMAATDLTETEVRALRPRIRMRVRITFTDQSSSLWEFVTGSGNLVDPAFIAAADPDLNQTQLNNAVAICDVARVEMEPGTNAEVFLPAEIIQYQLIEATNPTGGTVVTYEQRGSITPVFWPIQVDEEDGNGNTLQRNVGVRDVLSPVPNVICGSNVIITVNGVLTVPFLDPASPDAPSVDQDDLETVSRIGGRFEFVVSVQ